MRKDLTGQKFSYLTAVRELHYSATRKCMIWEYRCDCGKLSARASADVASRSKKGLNQSCGCHARKHGPAPMDVTGQKFGMLTAVENAGRGNRHGHYWLFSCQCGGTATRNLSDVLARQREGRIQNCGCISPTACANMHKRSYTKVDSKLVAVGKVKRPVVKPDGIDQLICGRW